MVGWPLVGQTEPVPPGGDQGIFAQATGEAAIINGDVPSARLEAIARAKWAAIEQAVGVQVKSQSLVQNAMLVDEAIQAKTGGVVKGFQVLGEGQRGDTYGATISAFVIPEAAEAAMGMLAKNTALTIFFPVQMPDGSVRESNPLAERLNNDLAMQGYEVIDIASQPHKLNAYELEQAMRSGNDVVIRSLFNAFLANNTVVGKVTFTRTGQAGGDIGYGIAMPFELVTARVTWRVMSKRSDGQSQIVASGSFDAQGRGPTAEDAAYKALNTLSEKLAPQLVSAVSNHFKGSTKKVKVTVANVPDVNSSLALKQTLQQIAWVLSVQNEGIGTYWVEYPENTVYLAAALGNKQGFKVNSFSDTSISATFTGFGF
ncbi:MAG: hypothetical protein AUJ55_07525 [Proteobacteria bacterium CG1_02_64_396]|nr:MAG: hypothetical protein AUJ55_07525 [Proteobacteria bacterium CG1_02_64_396]